jgi:hypothetical protein
MPGVLEPDCRVKPAVKPFTRLETNSRVRLKCVLNSLIKGLYLLGGGECNHPWRHDPHEHTALFSRGAPFASYSGPYRYHGPPFLAQPLRPGPFTGSLPVVFCTGL